MPDQNNRLLDVEKKVAAQEVLVAKFDAALDKLSEVSLNVSKLLAVHEQRLESQENMTKDIPVLLEERRKEYYTRFEEIHGRISDADQELRKEMASGQKEILGEIKKVGERVEELGDEMLKKHDDLRSDLEDDMENKLDAISARVGKVEKMVWWAAGGAAVLGFVITQGAMVFQALANIFH